MPGIALAGFALFVLLAFGLRSWLHRRRTGSTGFVGLSGRPVSVRELSARLSLHPNTLRPHLRRLEEAGLVRREVRPYGRARHVAALA